MNRLFCTEFDSWTKPNDNSLRLGIFFTALPHKILSADKFESGVRELRARFVTKLAQIMFSNLCIIGVSLQMALLSIWKAFGSVLLN